jgi:hypothetical protein
MNAIVVEKGAVRSLRLHSHQAWNLIVWVCAFGLLALLASAAPASADADRWDNLPDGRIVIEVKGHRFALPARGYDVSNVFFDYESLQDRATLADVLADPKKAKARFDRRSYVTISTGAGADPSPFLSILDRQSVRTLSFGFTVGDNPANCRYWDKTFDEVRALFSDESSTRNSGCRSHATGSATIYTYTGSGFEGIRPKLLNLVCDRLSYCHSSLWLASDLGFSFAFSSKVFPQQAWPEFLRRVDTILNSIMQ